MMNTTKKLLVLVGLFVFAAALVACDDEADSLLNGGKKNGPGASSSGETGITPEQLQCTDKPQGSRSYLQFDGQTKLEESRVNEGVAINRARFKPHAVMAGEYQRVLGVTPPSLANAKAAFDVPADRWFSEPSHSGVSLNAAFDVSFEACAASAAGRGGNDAPTEESAKAYCGTTMRKAWSRSPSPDELAACVDLATKKLNDEPDAKRKWAYVCASILSSSSFLTY
jgi:hypothetical protein